MSPSRARLLVLRSLVAALLGMPAPPAAGSPGASYAWPLAERGCLSSSFGEYRPRHFHSGLDFSTGGEEGKQVLAIGDGEVYRVLCGVTGFGKALYLKLDDGRFVLYGHLSRFAANVDGYLREIQVREKKYAQDLYPEAGRFRVKRGEVVAYSGQTGAGPPHLHMEIRENESDPLNPMEFGYAVKDAAAPTASAVGVEPLDRNGRVDGHTALVTVPLTWSPRERAWRMRAAPRVLGRVGLSVAALDAIPGCDARLAPYRLELRVDGRRVFRVTMHRVSYRTASEADICYRAEPVIHGAHLFRLHRLAEPARPGFGPIAGDGVLDARDGAIPAGEKETPLEPALEMAMELAPPRGPHFHDDSRRGGASPASAPADVAALESPSDAAYDAGGHGAAAAAPRGLLLGRGPHRVEILLSDYAGNETRIVGEIVAGSLARQAAPRSPRARKPARTAANSAAAPPAIQIAWRRDYLEIVTGPTPPGTGAPTARLERDAASPREDEVMEPLPDGRWVAVFDAPSHGESARVAIEIPASGGAGRLSRAIGPAWILTRRAGGEMPLGDGGGAIVAGPGELYFDTVFRARRVEPPAARAGLERVSPAYRVDAADALYERFPWIGLAAGDSLRTDLRVALYRSEGEGGSWRYVGRDSLAGRPGLLGGRDKPTGMIALMRDPTPPVVQGFTLTPSGFRAMLHDAGSGIDAASIALTVDGRWVPAEWDPERSLLQYSVSASGPHSPRQALLRVGDRAGNVVEVRWTRPG